MGDYSAMTVDPVDDTTMWYTQEYYATTSNQNWRTRMGNFRINAAQPLQNERPTRKMCTACGLVLDK